jgi:hypothetical protein
MTCSLGMMAKLLVVYNMEMYCSSLCRWALEIIGE